MTSKIKGLLQQINFIESDMEMQKQILFSIPSDQKDEMEKVITKIASLKEQVKELRLKIKELDPDEHNRIMAIEAASEKFRQIAATKKFVEVDTLNESGECFITVKEGNTYGKQTVKRTVGAGSKRTDGSGCGHA